MSYEPVPVPPLAPDKSSEERRLGENTMLEYLLRCGDITVKEEPLITTTLVPAAAVNVKQEWEVRTPTPRPVNKVEVIDLIDDDSDNGGDFDRDRTGATSTPPRVTDCVLIDRNAEAQHPPVKQPDVPNLVMCKASLLPSLRPVETNSGARDAEGPECCEPVPAAPPSMPSQADSESTSTQEPQCLGPFVETSSIKCPKCPVVLTDYYQILVHSCIDKHISRESKKNRIKCCFCDREYGTVHSLQNHIKTHVLRKYVKCSVCGKCLTSTTSFNAHALTHTNQWPYRCDICGKGSITEYHLEQHKATHTNEKPWMCDVCGATFRNENQLRNHGVVHLEKKYECDLCFAKFRERYKVKRHKERLHSDRKKEYQCETCSAAYTTKHQLKYHRVMKHDDNIGRETFVCSVCNKEFRHRFAFKTHMNKHKISNDNVMYTCDICKRNFARKPSLLRHILEHNGKQFSCSLCGMLFTQPSSVKRHMLKLHSSD